MNAELDFVPYLRPPLLDVPAAVALGHALLTVAPASGPEPVRAAAEAMRQTIAELQAAWASTQPAKAEDPRPIDTNYDGAWSALRERLAALATLAESEPALAESAERILGLLFPTGADFLRLPYAKQWAEAEKRIALAADQGLRPEIDRLAGAPFWAQVESLHQRYGEVLGITKAREPASPSANVLEALRAAQRAIGAYQIQLVAAALHDDGFVATATRALAPVDSARAAAARRGRQRDEPEVSPETPLPELPTA